MSRTIVIVGGGFAGVECALRLERRLPPDWAVTLYSPENFLTFTPLLAEVVGSSISPLHVVRPIRQMLKHTHCRATAVVGFDFPGNRIEYQLPQGGTAFQSYDHLVLACGMVVNANVVPGASTHAFALKTLGDALVLRNRLIHQLEMATLEPDPERRRRLLTFAILGGGFSGIEAAGEIFDLLSDCRRFYRSLQADPFRVVVVHSHERILPELPESLGNYARRQMEKRGIEMKLNVHAKTVTERGIHLTDDSCIEAGTVVCTIGNTVHPLMAGSGLRLEHGRVVTGPDLRVASQANVWAVGDCALVPNAHDGQPSPTLAQFAIRQAHVLAANLQHVLAGRPTRTFSYRMRGSFAAIGHHNAVGQVFGFKFSGLLAWLMWRTVYLAKMPTLARKVQVATDWAWDLVFPRDIVQLSLHETRR